MLDKDAGPSHGLPVLPIPPALLSHCCPVSGRAFTPAGPDRTCEHLFSQVVGSLCAPGEYTAHSKGQETQARGLTDALDPPSWNGTTHPWCPQALDSKPPFQSLSLPQRTQPREGRRCHVLWPMEGVPLVPVAFRPPPPPPPPHHSSSPTFKAQRSSREACPGHRLVSLL